MNYNQMYCRLIFLQQNIILTVPKGKKKYVKVKIWM